MGCLPSMPARQILLISVSSYTKNSQLYSRRNRSSPMRPRSSAAHLSSLSGCSLHAQVNGKNPFKPVNCSLPNSSNFLLASFHIVANVSSSLLGVLVITALPPVANVGDIEVQNSSAILGGTNANSSQYNSDILIPRPVLPVVVVETIRLPLSNSMLPLL